MSTAILSRFKALGLTPPFHVSGIVLSGVFDAGCKLVADCRLRSTATLLADALNEACREEAGGCICDRDALGRLAHDTYEAAIARMIDGCPPDSWDGVVHESKVAWRDAAEAVVRSSHREEAGQWVKCSERLPEGVFAKVRFVRLGRVHRGTFLRGNPPAYPSAFVDPLHQYWAGPDLVGTSDEVTHWMPDDDPQPPTTQPKEERR